MLKQTQVVNSAFPDFLPRDNFHESEATNAKTEIVDTLLAECLHHVMQMLEVLTSGSGSWNWTNVMFRVAVIQVL